MSDVANGIGREQSSLKLEFHEGGNLRLLVAAEGASVAETDALIEPARFDIAGADFEPDGVEGPLPGGLKEGLQQETSDALSGVLRIDDHALEFGC